MAEDNPTNQLVATQMLESMSANVTVATDGVEALERVHQGFFDVLLIDIEMPRMNGIELMRRLRADGGRIGSLPMIALTAYVMREHLAAIREAGADGVIAKPIQSIEQFGKEIREFMVGRAAQDAPASGASPAGQPAIATEDVPPATPGENAIDLAIFDALAEIIGQAAMSEFLGKVGLDIRAAAQRLQQAVSESDLDEARAATHVLISVAGTIGAVKAQQLARVVNNAAHAGDEATVRHEAAELLSEIGSVTEFVEARHQAAAT
ncbi:MAG TPA: response regulator [Thermohalobaculum sp.]|nr:response regulator [Thermohalobaculum sp.]